MILISGVVLLTLKKPEKNASSTGANPGSSRSTRGRSSTLDSKPHNEENEHTALRGDERDRVVADETVWQVGDDSDDEEGGRKSPFRNGGVIKLVKMRPQEHAGEEGVGLMDGQEADEEEHDEIRRSASSDATLAGGSGSHSRDSDEFGNWKS
jgi:hypothetical protein